MDTDALGPYLAYGWYETGRTVKGSCDDEGFNCDYTIRRGGIRLIEGLRRGRLVTRTPVAAFGLSSTGTIAYVRATTGWHSRSQLEVVEQRFPSSVIEIITLWSPTVLHRLQVPGHATRVAVTDRVLAAYLQTRTHWAIVFHDLWVGRKLRMVRLRRAFSGALALNGSRAFMFMDRKLVELEAYSGVKRVLARLPEGAGGLAFAGDKLVWYENRRNRVGPWYRIVAMSVDRR